MKRQTFIVFLLLILPNISAEDDEDDDEEEVEVTKVFKARPAAVLTTSQGRAISRSLVKTTIANSISTSDVSSKVTMPTFPQQQTTMDVITASSFTIENNYATVTYSGQEIRPKCLPYKCVSEFPNGNRVVPASLGRLKFVCNKTFFFSKIEASWTDAQEICCSFNMRLYNVESYSQMQCIRSLHFDSGVHQRLGNVVYWVGGSDEKSENKFGWCELNQPFPDWIGWANTEPDNMGGENCVTLDGVNNGQKSTPMINFADRNCQTKLQFLCEDSSVESIQTYPGKLSISSTTTEVVTARALVQDIADGGEYFLQECLPYNCTVNEKLKADSKRLETLGRFISICNKTYFLSYIELSWVRAQEMCCNLNMRLVNIESLSQFQCLTSPYITSGIFLKLMGLTFFWLGGSDQETERKFGWCEINRTFQNWLAWKKNEPDNASSGGENCVLLEYFFTPIKKGQYGLLSDRSCTERHMFICEEFSNEGNSALVKGENNSNKPNVKKIEKRGGCKRPKCLLFNCFPGPTTMANGSNALNVTGKISNVCKKKYLFSRIKATWTRSQEICCSFNMTLLALETKKEMDCIRSLRHNSGPNFNMKAENIYWTDGSDQGCEDKFGWCTSRLPIQSWLAWGPNNPDNMGGAENCISFHHSVNTWQVQQSYFCDKYCEDSLHFICEEIVTEN